jgi:STE24 endopeptidase
LTIVFLAALVVSLGVRLTLAGRQVRHVRAHRHEVPAAFAEKIPLDAHQKAADYTVARVRFGRIALVARAALLLAWTLGGGLALLRELWPEETLLGGTALVLSAFLVSELLLLPLVLWSTFVIEQRFGFNRTTPNLFLADLSKQLLLGTLLGGAITLAAIQLI